MAELPNFSDSAAVVEWLGENLTTEGWEVLKPELLDNGYQGLVDWFDPLPDDERESYVADETARESVVEWLASSATGEAGQADWAAAEAAGGAAEAAAPWEAEPATATVQRAANEPEPADPAVALLGPGNWDDARQAWLYYDPARGWVLGDGRSMAEADAQGAAPAAAAADPAAAAAEPAAAAAEPALAAEPAAAAAEPAAAATDADAAPEEAVLPELPETTQAMVEEAVSEEIAPVFDEAFSNIEGLDQLSPEDLREVLAAALAESGISQ